MKTKVIVIVVMCLIVTLCGCGKKKTIRNTSLPGKDYALQFPDTWETKDTGVMGTDLIGLSPLEDPQDTFRENVTVMLESMPESMTDAEYLKLTLTNMSNIFGLPSEANFTKTKVGTADGYHLLYSMQMGQNEMDNDVYIVIDKGAVYVLTCSHLKGKRNAFKATMDAVIETFAIK